MTQAMIMPKKYFFDDENNPLAFGKVYAWQAGTVDEPRPTYTTSIGDIENPNPVILNDQGYAAIYLEGDYFIEVYDANDVLIWNEDNVSSVIVDEWSSCYIPTYASTTSVTIPGDVTGIYEVGRSVRLNNNGTFTFSFITASSYADDETTVVINDAFVTVSIEQICVSIISSDSFNSPQITGGTINGAVIGGDDPKDGTFLSITGKNTGGAGDPTFAIENGVGGGTGMYGSNISGAEFLSFSVGGNNAFSIDDAYNFAYPGSIQFRNSNDSPFEAGNPSIYSSASGGAGIPFTLSGNLVYEGRDVSTTGHYFLAGSSQNVRFTIEGGGSVGCNTDNPTTNLHIVEGSGQTGNPTNSDTMILLDNNAQDNTYIEFTSPAPSSGYGQGILFSDGSSGVGRITYVHNTDEMTFRTAGADRWAIESSGHLEPSTNNSYNIGSASKRIDTLYSQNSVNVSDERIKNKLSGIDKIADLMLSIDPELFSYKDDVIPATPAVMGKRQVTEEVDAVKIIIKEDKNGKHKKVKKQIKRKIKVFKQEPLFDEKGEAILVKNKKGKLVPKLHDVPVMEEYEVEPARPEKTISHSRPHTGFMAQQVKAKMEELGIADWAGYRYEEDADLHMLLMTEFIAPILKLAQRQDAKQAEFETRLAALEKG